MAIFHNLIQIVQIIAALIVIGLVLVQHGKGADMGAAFGGGGGASGSVFGATGSANFLSRATAIAATTFFISTLLLAFVINNHNAANKSIIQKASEINAASKTATVPNDVPVITKPAIAIAPTVVPHVPAVPTTVESVTAAVAAKVVTPEIKTDIKPETKAVATPVAIPSVSAAPTKP